MFWVHVIFLLIIKSRALTRLVWNHTLAFSDCLWGDFWCLLISSDFLANPNIFELVTGVRTRDSTVIDRRMKHWQGITCAYFNAITQSITFYVYKALLVLLFRRQMVKVIKDTLVFLCFIRDLIFIMAYFNLWSTP